MFSPFVILDKSFLQGRSYQHLWRYAWRGWIFGVPHVLLHEQLRKRDDDRVSNFRKLRDIEVSLRLLPDVGEMLRAENDSLKPASSILDAKLIEFSPESDFNLDDPSQRSVNQKESEYRERCEPMIEVWRDFNTLPELRNATGTTRMPEVVNSLANKLRDDREEVREVHRRYYHPTFPNAEHLDENWSYYRWWQVMLLGGLGYYSSYGVDREPQREKLLHELFDLIYLLYAALVGGFACREERAISRFKLLRPDGIVIK